MFPQKAAYKSDHVILDKQSLENDLKDFSFTFVELPKFNKDVDHLSNMTEKWCYFFKHAESISLEEMLKLIADDEIMEKAYKQLDRVTWSDAELLTYDQAEKYEGAYLASMEQKFDEGFEKGKFERDIEIARTLLTKKYEIEVVADITGLTIEQIKVIKGN